MAVVSYFGRTWKRFDRPNLSRKQVLLTCAALLAPDARTCLPRQATMVPGGGNADIAVTTMDVYGPESCTWVGGFGHSRIGISCALAAKLAQPKRPVVAIAGDGSSGLKGRRIVASEGVTT